LGATAAGVQVAATLHYAALGPTRADTSARGGVYGILMPGLPRAIDMAWEATASGDATAGIDVKKARLAIGPLVGPIAGTIKRFDEGVRVDLAWAAGPVPCAAFAGPLGLGQPFDIGYEVRKLAAAAGIKGMEGAVSATVKLSFDSRDPGASKLEFSPQIGCRGP
jgi:hypothetical protein